MTNCDQNYIYCIHRLKEILKEYESGSFTSSLAEISSIVDDLQPEDYSVYGKTICHMLIDVAQHERFCSEAIPISNRRPHSYDSFQQLIAKKAKAKSDEIKKVKKQKMIKHSKVTKKKEKRTHHYDSDFADSDSDTVERMSFDDNDAFNSKHFYSNYKYQACNKKYSPQKGDHYQTMCSYEMSNDYYPTFPQWIPTVDLSCKKRKKLVICD